MKKNKAVRNDKGQYTAGTGGRPARGMQLKTLISNAMKSEGMTQEQFLQSVIRRAEAGDSNLTRLIVELSWPKARPQMVPFDFGFDETMDVGQRAAVVEAAAMSGKCSVDVALAMMQLLETKSRLAEFASIMAEMRNNASSDPGAQSFLKLIQGDVP